jgi:hypothetical protein
MNLAPPAGPERTTIAPPETRTSYPRISARELADTPLSSVPRWFDAIDPNAVPAAPARREAAAPLFVIALLFVALGRGILLRAALPIVLAILAVVILVRGVRRVRPAPARRRGLSLDRQRMSFHSGGRSSATPLLSLAAPFGVTLLSTRPRDRVVAVLSSAEGTFYVGAAVDAASRKAHPLLDRATTLSRDDMGLSAIAPDGEPIDLSASDLVSLLEALIAIDPCCIDRLVLSDTRGAPITLDSRELCVGERKFDLSAPLEWRAMVFQEAFGPAVAVYQGTWIRQNGSEVVLVALLPSLLPGRTDEGLSGLDYGALRDLRLMQAIPEDPPQPEKRVAIERLFMLPLRSALDKAPRGSRASA